MIRTRGMDKLSAVNRAKTRGGKARALNDVAGKQLVMESVTIPGRHRALKRTRTAAEPVELAHPPTPIGEEAPGAAAESTVLRDGWTLIKRYFIDQVGPDAVSGYLESVMDPVSKDELEKGFSAAMSCEDDEARQIVEAKIEEKLKQFGRFSWYHFHSTH